MQPEQEIKVLQELKQLLLQEKQEDFEAFRKLMEQLPLDKRRAQGLAWYPLQVTQQGYTLGERAFLTVERTSQLGTEHQFRSGKVVRLFSQVAGVRNPERIGVVYWVDKDRMRIVLNARDLPDWLGLRQLAVDLQFDERTYLEMEKALEQVMKAGQGRLAELRAVLLGSREPVFRPLIDPPIIPELNPSQNEAIQTILSAEDVAIIHGPPGTGKTTTLVYGIRELCQTEACVLVTAPSNTAVDLLTERLADAGLRVVRLGNISRVDENLIRHTLEVQVAEHPDAKHIKKVKMQAAELRKQAHRFKRRFDHEARDQRRSLKEEANELSAWANQLEDRLVEQILDGAQVITCTLVGAAHPVLEKRKFRTVVVDEAAQALEPATWIPILRASRVVLTGDPFQLPPTVKSRIAQKGGFNITLMEKWLEREGTASLLRTQYRMNAIIMGFSNQQFYGNALEAAPQVKNWCLPEPHHQPLIFIDTAGTGFEEKMHAAYQSRYNPEEYMILREHLYQLLDAVASEEGTESPSIALISPYREQVVHMTEAVREDPRLMGMPLTINTIDGFQGQERDVVYLSLVRSNGKTEIGFLQDFRRMNVAMTRARKQLVVVGDSATIGATPFYQQFLEYCELHGAYRTAWEYMHGS